MPNFKNMSAKEFATTYTGRTVVTAYNPDGLAKAQAKVIGYNKEPGGNIVLAFDGSTTYGGWPTGKTKDQYHLFETSEHAWSVSVSDILEILPNSPIVLYKHICKICHSPARKNKEFSLCSNSSCKINKRYRKSLFAGIQKPPPGRDYAGFLICPTCNRRANGIAMGGAQCNSHHSWAVELFIDGDKLEHVYGTYEWQVRPGSAGWVLLHKNNS